MGIGIISPVELIEALRGAGTGISIVDARRRNEFLAGHVPGAVCMDWESWCDPAPAHAGPTIAQKGYWGVLAAIDDAACGARLSALGLRDGDPIVVYADGPKTRGRDGRIAWMLAYLGAQNIRLLDAGWSGWVAAGGQTELEAVVPEPGSMTVRVHPERRRSLPDLRSAYTNGTFPLPIDTRSRDEYSGKIQAYLPRPGRLPGARLVPFVDLFDADGHYLAAEQYAAAIGPDVAAATDLVAYCEVGVRASLFALLHEIRTGRIVPVYDGSIMEWGLQPDLPVEADPPQS